MVVVPGINNSGKQSLGVAPATDGRFHNRDPDINITPLAVSDARLMEGKVTGVEYVRELYKIEKKYANENSSDAEFVLQDA
jgi:hypothetical protein